MNTRKTKQQSLEIGTELLTKDDCFGKEWQNGAAECSMCMAQSVCMIVTTKAVFDKGEKHKQEGTEWADLINFNNVPTDDILSMIKAGGVSLEDVREVFAEFSKCADKVTVNQRVNIFLMDNKIMIKDGTLHTV